MSIIELHFQGGPKGYVYILFDCDKSVKELLKQCTHDYSNGGEYYYKMSSRRMRCKEVQVGNFVLGFALHFVLHFIIILYYPSLLSSV